jgi:hypothetical protein
VRGTDKARGADTSWNDELRCEAPTTVRIEKRTPCIVLMEGWCSDVRDPKDSLQWDRSIPSAIDHLGQDGDGCLGSKKAIE